ncbi:Lipoyltransferase 1, mitochondrial [Tyrophagus putrescentiae]|nr:Lipoyltransferase 1, mitochondrial [Tyrophagus putrescentiae]
MLTASSVVRSCVLVGTPPLYWKLLNSSTRRHQQTLSTSKTSPARKPSRTNLEAVRPVQHLLQNGTVLLSTSDDILANLALEEWLYRHYDFSQADELVLLLWANRPAVVVGRHQNVWSEVSVDYCRREGIQILPHLEGRLQPPPEPRTPLHLLSTAFSIDTSISPREDLVVSSTGEKVSGTASKLNATNSYHHCTLLVDVDRQALRRSLRSSSLPIAGLVSNATRSVPSPVLNLKTLNGSLSIDSLVGQLVRHFPSRAQSQGPSSSALHLVDPTDDRLFADITSIRENFSTWAWTFARTPKFSLEEEVVKLEGEVSTLRLTVEKGLITSVCYSPEPTLDFGALLGTRFERQPLLDALDRFKTNCEAEDRKPIIDAILSAYQRCCQ